jgi:hypothetical protein
MRVDAALNRLGEGPSYEATKMIRHTDLLRLRRRIAESARAETSNSLLDWSAMPAAPAIMHNSALPLSSTDYVLLPYRT